MKNLDLRHIESFVHFHLNQKEGIDGRRKRSTKITRSLRTFWDGFRLLYRREALADIDWKVDRNAVNNVRHNHPRDPAVSDRSSFSCDALASSSCPPRGRRTGR